MSGSPYHASTRKTKPSLFRSFIPKKHSSNIHNILERYASYLEKPGGASFDGFIQNFPTPISYKPVPYELMDKVGVEGEVIVNSIEKSNKKNAIILEKRRTNPYIIEAWNGLVRGDSPEDIEENIKLLKRNSVSGGKRRTHRTRRFKSMKKRY